jgi:hypothetical protein
LAHLDIRHREGDLPVAADSDESVRLESIDLRGFGFVDGEEAQAQHQAAAGGRADLKEPAPRKTGRSLGLSRIRGARSDVIEDHD